jgi:hypothetical protein
VPVAYRPKDTLLTHLNSLMTTAKITEPVRGLRANSYRKKRSICIAVANIAARLCSKCLLQLIQLRIFDSLAVIGRGIAPH